MHGMPSERSEVYPLLDSRVEEERQDDEEEDLERGAQAREVMLTPSSSAFGEKSTDQAKASMRSVASSAASGAYGLNRIQVVGRRRSRSHWDDGLDIVQFSAAVYFVEEDEGSLTVEVMRIGAVDGFVSVRFMTMDASAKAGMHYEETVGAIEFTESQQKATIKVRILEDNRWNPTLEFKIRLLDPDNCILGHPLHICRVKIIDSSVFPSDNLIKSIQFGERGIDAIPSHILLMDFVRLVYGARGIRWRTLVTFAFDQIQNIYLFFTLKLTVYFANVLFSDDPSMFTFFPGLSCELLIAGDRNRTGQVLGLIYFAPLIIMQAWEYFKVEMDLYMTVLSFLRQSLMRKYLNYDDHSRHIVTASDMEGAIMADMVLVTRGYVAVVELVRVAGRVLAMVIFTMTAQPSVAVFVAAIPVLLFLYALRRSRDYSDACRREQENQRSLAGFVDDVSVSYNLIAEYQQRPQVNDVLARKLQQMQLARQPREMLEMTITYAPKYLGPLMAGCFIAFMAPRVLFGTMSLGAFVAVGGVFTQTSDEMGWVYRVLVSLSATLGPLRKLTFYLNLQTDVRTLKSINRARRAVTSQLMREAEVEGHGIDYIPIKFIDFSFEYKVGGFSFRNLDLTVQQGQLIAIISQMGGAGRKTLLQLLGQRLFPTGGLIMIPSFLRVLHVSAQPMVLGDDLWRNLIFGDQNADQDRVMEILEIMEMDATRREIAHQIMSGTTDVVDEFSLDKVWYNTFSELELVKLHLARAFIMNPEVLVLQRPLVKMSKTDHTHELILQLIREHVDNRGLCLPPATRHLRRPRTCFFTPESAKDAQAADVIWNIREAGQIGVLEVTEINEVDSEAGHVGGHEEEREDTMVPGNPSAVDGVDKIDGSPHHGELTPDTVERFKTTAMFSRNFLDGISRRAVEAQFRIDQSALAEAAGDVLAVMSPGLQYYERKSEDAGDATQDFALWHTAVWGVDEGDGWVRVKDRYLRKEVRGVPVLLAANDWDGRRSPAGPRNSEQLTMAMLSQDIADMPISATASICDEASVGQPVQNDRPIVQWSASVFYVNEDEGTLCVKIIRLGNFSSAVSVSYQTVEASAKEGIHYSAMNGTVMFKEGVTDVEIKVPVIEDEGWNPTLEFKLKLFNPRLCELGKYLHTCRVKIIDNGVFPSEKLRPFIEQGDAGIERISGLYLMTGFLKMIWSVRGIAWRTVLTLLVDQMKTLYLYFTLFIRVYFADVLFAENPEPVQLLPMWKVALIVPGDRLATAKVLGLMMFAPILVMSIWDVIQVHIDIRGHTLTFLRASLFRKYLNYDERSRAAVRTSDMQVSLVKDVSEVANAYMLAVNLALIVAKLWLIIFFAIQRSPSSIWIILVEVAILFGYILMSARGFAAAVVAEGDADMQVVKFVHETCSNYTLIAEYMQRPQMNDAFAEKLDMMHHAILPKRGLTWRTYSVPKMLGPLLSGFYIATQSPSVIAGSVSLGTFLATYDVFDSISDAFNEAYTVLMLLSSVLPALETLTHLFNKSTDVGMWKEVAQQQHSKSHEMKVSASRSMGGRRRSSAAESIEPIVDRLNIQLMGVFSGVLPGSQHRFEDINLSITQGNLVCVLEDSEGAGRNVLLQMLGQRVVPPKGLVLIPTHLRVVHVSATPMFFGETLWSNLIFGDMNAEPSRVIAILEEMQMHQSLKHLKANGMTSVGKSMRSWENELTSAELAKVQLARALIMNPEVLVLQRPLQYFSHSQSRKLIMRVLQKHTHNRGLCMPTEDAHRRRPRTCFFGTERKTVADCAQVVLSLSSDGKLRCDKGAKHLAVPLGREEDSVFSSPRNARHRAQQGRAFDRGPAAADRKASHERSGGASLGSSGGSKYGARSTPSRSPSRQSSKVGAPSIASAAAAAAAAGSADHSVEVGRSPRSPQLEALRVRCADARKKRGGPAPPR